MKSKWSLGMLVVATLVSVGWAAQATFAAMGRAQHHVRATEMTPLVWSQIEQGMQGATNDEWIIEFRAGDKLPLTIAAGGDLVESVESPATQIAVKRLFFIRVAGEEVTLSLDGQVYKPIKDTLTGNVSAGMSSNNGVASAFQVTFQAFLKQ